ncbi:MAG: hypothetical protein WC792_05635 [Candidatus Micrarchaeia archaeon]
MKGFFSVFTVALSVFLIALVAGAALSLYGAQAAAQADLEAKVVSDRFDDFSNAFNGTVADALLDYSYSKSGCAGSGGSFCSANDAGDRVYLYLANNVGNMSASGIPIGFSPAALAVACAAGSPATAVLDGFSYDNYSVSAIAPFSLNSSVASRLSYRGFNWTVFVAPSAGSGTFFRVRVHNETVGATAALLKNVSVYCP